MTTALRSVFDAASVLVRDTPELRTFSDWPVDVPSSQLTPTDVPGTALLEGFRDQVPEQALALFEAILAAIPEAEWRQTYSEDEVGRHFLDRYGYFELLGPSGHFRSDETRAFIGFWGAGLEYDWHHHEAEELYFVLAGEAVFEAEGMQPRTLKPLDHQLHTSNQPHAMNTLDSGVLTFVLWRGAGLGNPPQMGFA